MRFLFVVSLLFTIAADDFFGTCLGANPSSSFVSVLGDRGMTNPDARFAFEGWNACNEVGEEARNMGSPRMADCFDLNCPIHDNKTLGLQCNVAQKVSDHVNGLKAGDPFPAGSKISLNSSSADVNKYAAEKEKYLGSLCQKNDTYFWMIMLKNGNLDMNSMTCPKYGRKVNNKSELTWDKTFPCYGSGCMNQPLVFRRESSVDDTNPAHPSLTGGFHGSYDLDAPSKYSSFSVTWKKNITTTSTPANSSSWILSFKLTTSPKYPWLSLFLRADAATGPNAGYHYDGRGIMNIKSLPTSPNFRVRMNLHIIKGGGEISQFSLTNIGGCWKNNGDPCNGDVKTDVTRYVQMIINPEITITCGPKNLKACPRYHTSTTTGERIYREDNNFPYEAYHLYCAPGNALNETNIDKCDPFTNPLQQELVQIIPHPEWAKLGYPGKMEDVGWEGTAPIKWDLDAGNLTAGMYFYQDPITTPATRTWSSIIVGTEMYNLKSDVGHNTTEWTVSDFDVVVPIRPKKK